MFSATAGAHELCGLCGDIGRVADAVDASTLSADDEDVARRLLDRVCAMLEGGPRLGHAGQRSGPYQTAGRSAAAVTERTGPPSCGGGQ